MSAGGEEAAADYMALKEEEKRLAEIPSIVRVLFLIGQWEIVTAFLLKACSDIMQFANPFLLESVPLFLIAIRQQAHRLHL